MHEPNRDERPAGRARPIQQRHVDNVLVVRVAGDIDLRTGPHLREAITDSIAAMAGGRVIVDLSHVTFLGSIGLAALTDAATQATRHGGQLRIVAGNNHAVLQPIQATGLDHRLVLCHNLEQAIAG